MRDGDTRSKENRHAGWYPAARVEPLLSDPNMVERMLFPPGIFDVEASAAMLEEILDVDDGPLGDIIRGEVEILVPLGVQAIG